MALKKYICRFALSLIILSCCISLQAQHSGNIIYRNSTDYFEIFNNRGIRKFSATPTSLEMSVSILLNQKADKYVITLGVSQEDKTPKLCLSRINARIAKFVAQIKQFGINKENIFMDFISQVKIYDFEKDEKNTNVYQQLEKGFEIKKNVIIQLSRNEQIEQVIAEASESEIYDIVKVEYINNDMEKIYSKLLQEAKDIISRKQADYIQKFSPTIIGTPTADDKFYYSFPKDQYKQYEAAETAGLDRYSYNDYTIKKIARKNRTAYYDGMNYSGFDKVINNADPEPCIQYALVLSVRYELGK